MVTAELPITESFELEFNDENALMCRGRVGRRLKLFTSKDKTNLTLRTFFTGLGKCLS